MATHLVFLRWHAPTCEIFTNASQEPEIVYLNTAHSPQIKTLSFNRPLMGRHTYLPINEPPQEDSVASASPLAFFISNTVEVRAALQSDGQSYENSIRRFIAAAVFFFFGETHKLWRQLNTLRRRLINKGNLSFSSPLLRENQEKDIIIEVTKPLSRIQYLSRRLVTL
ncbi:hypothetical protein BDP55DRAFT_636305 [Colletotrichum godetiae]|uniref:Uncharacterized protein n=1 Tax=Colletotrichum godetiae TaxID=1209918 RepID=A0AAJ0ER37_9PEZI|nr:uncharacterized protein BDP55DRAFT_636305 [Colletotrichum godetiae]KAK1660152.1 hypothetical protein BDP55DRAFT_636305 [Colletotrichum godetiae]